MPATEVLALTRGQRRRRYCWNLFGEFCARFIILVIFVAFIGMCFFAYLETTVTYHPRECFDLLQNCEILEVVHEYNKSNPLCSDIFEYTWSLPGSPVVFRDRELRRRAASECLLDLNIGVENASFRNGTNRCFRIKSLFNDYSRVFSPCARVLELNNGSASECQTIFTPTSNYDATLSIILVVVYGTYFCCQVFGFIFGGVEVPE